MIGHVEGKALAVIRDTVIIETASVGYRVRVLAGVAAKTREGEALSLWTHLAVRENSQELFGFETKEELQWFELLLTVSGIGPRSALSIMNSADIKALEDAIATNDASILARAFGIGRKTAEKIVLELKEKVTSGSGKETPFGDGGVVDALVSLGYTMKEARDAARALPKDIEGEENRIREALRLMSRSA